MKVYQIVKTGSQCNGHGDYSTSTKIAFTGPYDIGDPYPLYRDKAEAERVAADKFMCSVIELELL